MPAPKYKVTYIESTGRAHTALLEGITVDYYGAKTPLNQLATLSAPEPTLLVVQPYDKSSIKAIERAILESDVGLTDAGDAVAFRRGGLMSFFR